MNLEILRYVGGISWKIISQPHLDLSDWEVTLQKQCTPWKSSLTLFGDTGSNAVCTTIVGVNWWKRFHSGGFVQYPTGRGPGSKIIGIRKIDIWMWKTKMFRIVLKEREGQILLKIKKLCELLKLKLLEDQTIFLRARMVHTRTYKILILAGRSV